MESFDDSNGCPNFCLILSDFDIDKGNVVRLQFPTMGLERCQVFKTFEYIAEQMLPDGAHQSMEDWSLFILNRPSAIDEFLECENKNEKHNEEEHVKVEFYTLGSQKCSEMECKESWAVLESCQGVSDLHFQPRFRSESTSIFKGTGDELDNDVSETHLVVGQVQIQKADGSQATLTLYQDMVFTLVLPNPFAPPAGMCSSTKNDPSLLGSARPPSQVREDCFSSTSFPLSAGCSAADIHSNSSESSIAAHWRNPAGGSDDGQRSVSTLYSSDGETFDDSLPLEGATTLEDDSSIFATLDGTPFGKLGILFASIDDCKVFIGWLTSDPNEGPSRQPPGSPQNCPSPPPTLASAPYAYRCLTCVQTKKDSSVRRGAVCKALACVAPSHWPFIIGWQPLLSAALQRCFGQPLEQQARVVEDLHEVLSRLHREYHLPSAAQASVWRFSLASSRFQWAETSCRYLDQAFALRYPAAWLRDDISFPSASLCNLISLFKDATMQIFNAILLEKRVLFLGRLRPIGQLVGYVLSAVRLVCPPLQGLMDQRVFPYASLVNLTWMQTAAYIAGTVNPLVESKAHWWDVLCDLDHGKVVMSPIVAAEVNHPRRYTYDMDFFHGLVHAIHKMQATQKEGLCIENFVHDSFCQLVTMLLSMADPTDPLSKRVDPACRAANAVRVRAIQSTRGFKAWMQQKATAEYEAETQFDTVVAHLRNDRLSHDQLLVLLQSVLGSTGPSAQLVQFLSAFRVSRDGLLPLAALLFHPCETIRIHCVCLMERLETLQEGRQAIQELNKFMCMAYDRIRRTMPPLPSPH
eukprot:GGOE01062210.1.p1 GENE.GGOE01062210.1~~GGOE01062210.1.p1  ORF type:complete len:807 (+),score=126.02 GGOE01062210.1:37-2457(+)